MTIKVLAVGDVCGRVGLEFLRKNLRKIQRQYAIDFTVVNGENANVVGVTPAQCEEIFDAGADVITLGNHTWTRTEIQDYLDHASACLRPANYAPQCPGRGVGVYDTRFGRICVANLIGRFSLDANTDNPFVVADNIMTDVDAKVILVDKLLLGNASVTVPVAAAVALSLTVTIIVAKIIGAVLPIVAKKIGLDPAVMASPLITTLVDAISLILYFFVSTGILGL